MIEPDENKKSQDKDQQAAEIILEILKIEDTKSKEFQRKIQEIYEGVILDDEAGYYRPEPPFIKEAIFLFEFCLKHFPEHLDLLKYYTGYLCENNKFRRSVPYLRKIVELEPDSWHAWNFLGFSIFQGNNDNVREGGDDLGDPEPYFKKATELNETYREAWFNLGMFYRSKEYFRDAIYCLEKAFDLDPSDNFAIFVLGHVYQSIGNSNLAIKRYKMSLELNPCYDSAWNNLGLEYAKRFEFKKAIQMYVRALQFNVDSDIIWHNLRFAYIGTEQFEKAEYCEQKAKKLKPIQSEFLEKQEKMRDEKEIWYYI